MLNNFHCFLINQKLNSLGLVCETFEQTGIEGILPTTVHAKV